MDITPLPRAAYDEAVRVAIAWRAALPDATTLDILRLAANQLGITYNALRMRLRRARDKYGADLGSLETSSARKRKQKKQSRLNPFEDRRLRDALARANKEKADALREANRLADLRGSVFGLVDPMPVPATFSTITSSGDEAETIVVMLSDWHWGESVSLEAMDGLNSYSLAIARARAARIFRAILSLATKHWAGLPPQRLILILGGDMISGEIHDELAKHNEALSLPAVKDCAGHIMAGLNLLLEGLACLIDVISLPGNHGRSTRKPESKGLAETSYDTLLADVLELHFKGNDRLRFYKPPSGDALFDVSGWQFFATHGDRVGSRGGAGFVGPAATAARGFKRVVSDLAQRGALVDVILIGHFHTALQLEEGYVNGSLVGPSEYSRDGRFRPQQAQQLFLSVHPKRGVTQNRWLQCGAPEEGTLYEPREGSRQVRPRYRVKAIYQPRAPL